jgi:hypothetical protein
MTVEAFQNSGGALNLFLNGNPGNLSMVWLGP